MVALIAATLIWAVTPAGAAFPGADGLLAVEPVNGPGLILVRSTGRREHLICTDLASCGLPRRPQWSPDGRSLAFVAAPAGSVAGPIKVVAPDGTCVDCQYGSARSPSFGPNGDVISFLTARGQFGSDGLDGFGTAAHQILATGGAAPSTAVWSAFGQLAVAAGGQIWVEPVNGSLRSIGTGGSPNWSPTGERLAIARAGWIWVINPSTGRGVKLVRGNAPAFSPSGGDIAFIGAGHDVEIIPAAGGRARRVGTVTGLSLDWQPRPQSSTVCQMPPDGTTLLANTTAVVEAYENPMVPNQAVMSCLRAQGVSRLLESQSSSPEASNPLPEPGVAAATGNEVWLTLVSGPEKGEGFNITSLNAFNATTGVAAPSNTVPVLCDAVDSQTDPDVDPPSPCGINALVVAADGDYAVEETSMSYDPNAACTPFCGSPLATGVTWQQEVVEHTPQGNLVLTDISQDGSSGAGISDLTLVGSTLSWEQNGAHESAQLS